MLFHVTFEVTVGVVTMKFILADVTNSYGADMLTKSLAAISFEFTTYLEDRHYITIIHSTNFVKATFLLKSL